MSRQRIPMQDGGLLVIGWDDPFASWFAIRYDDADEDAAPRAVIGYCPAEAELLRAERPDAVVGPFPVRSAARLLKKLIPEVLGIEPASEQPPCVYCKRPPWRRNDDCPDHPWNRLRFG